MVNHNNPRSASKLGIDGFCRKKAPTPPDDNVRIPQMIFVIESLTCADGRCYD
jgi:hypothetical protein